MTRGQRPTQPRGATAHEHITHTHDEKSHTHVAPHFYPYLFAAPRPSRRFGSAKQEDCDTAAAQMHSEMRALHKKCTHSCQLMSD